MKLIKSILIIALSLPVFLTACSTSEDAADAYKGETPHNIFKAGEEALRDRNYQDALKHFEALDVQYPFGQETEMAQLHSIYAYYMTADYASSEAAADRFIQAHPTSVNADYAYFIRGLADYQQNLGIFEQYFAVDLATRDLKHLKKAHGNFSTLVSLYPTSKYAPAARQYLIYLRNLLANHELEVANYYYAREAYVAAANRASLVIRHYQGAPAVPGALVVMAKSYHALHLTREAEDVLKVLHHNYPTIKP